METLQKNITDSPCSVTETRILFELIGNGPRFANELVKTLHMDKSYISRILKSFEKKEYIRKSACNTDRRSVVIELTDSGRAVGLDLLERSNQQIAALIEHLNEEDCTKICEAMDMITCFFSQYQNRKEKK